MCWCASSAGVLPTTRRAAGVLTGRICRARMIRPQLRSSARPVRRVSLTRSVPSEVDAYGYRGAALPPRLRGGGHARNAPGRRRMRPKPVITKALKRSRRRMRTCVRDVLRRLLLLSSARSPRSCGAKPEAWRDLSAPAPPRSPRNSVTTVMSHANEADRLLIKPAAGARPAPPRTRGRFIPKAHRKRPSLDESHTTRRQPGWRRPQTDRPAESYRHMRDAPDHTVSL
jgi:hypothetical protein